MNGNFTELQPLHYWVQRVIPLVYDDSLSFLELSGKITKTLNDLIQNNNLLPDYIMKLIMEYISSGAINKVLSEILANYMLNVKFPPKGLTPAVGDGTADDTLAIQGCINYAYQNGGMAVYFPSGAYLTQALTLNKKVTLFGQDRYTTRMVMKGGATKPMFTGIVDELSLSGLGFDGNMDIQVNNVNLFNITVNSAIITNVLMTDGYDLLNITVNNDLQISNTFFKHAVENGIVINGAGNVQADNLIFESISELKGKSFAVINVSNSIFEKIKCKGAAPVCFTVTGSNNVLRFWNDHSLKSYTDTGNNNSISVYTKEEIVRLSGNSTESIAGNALKTITGTFKEDISGNKNLIARSNVDEKITGNKVTSVSNLTETIKGDKTTTAADISENATNKTIRVNDTFHVMADIVDFISTNKTMLTSKDVIIDSANPVTYKKPLNLDRYSNYVPFKDISGKEYKVMVSNDFVPDYVNVRDYGAKGDGITDDTTAIQNAINALTVRGGKVMFPSGVYIIKDTITIGDGTKSTVSTKNCVALVGENNSATNLAVWAGDNGTCIKYKGTVPKPMVRILGPILDPVIENITLWGENVATHGIHMTCCGQAKLNKVSISDVTKIGLFIDVWNGLTVTGTTNNIQCEFSNIFINVAFNPNAVCLKTQAFGDKPNVDTNMCAFRNLFLLYNGTGGTALYLGFMDASLFQSVHCFKNGDSVGSHSIVFDGTELTGYPHELSFYNISPSTDGYDVKGTIGNIQFYELMVGDGAPVPNHPSLSGFTSSREIFGNYYFSNTVQVQNATPALTLVANDIAKQTRFLKNATATEDYGSVWEDTTKGQITALGIENHKLKLDATVIFDSVNPSGITLTPLALQNGWTGTLNFAKDNTNKLYIKGNLIPGTKDWGTTIAQLPAGFAPSSTCCLVGYNVNGEVITGFVITTAGIISIYKPADTNAFTTSVVFNQIFML